MKNYKISEEILQSILNYLAKRPYEEVFKGIQALTFLEEIKEQENGVM